MGEKAQFSLYGEGGGSEVSSKCDCPQCKKDNLYYIQVNSKSTA